MKISQSDKDYAVDAGLETEIKPTTRLVARTAGRSPAPGLQLEPLENSNCQTMQSSICFRLIIPLHSCWDPQIVGVCESVLPVGYPHTCKQRKIYGNNLY